MASSNDNVHNEMLCYLQNNFSSTAKNILMASLSAFYSIDEVSHAKTLLFSEAESIKGKGAVVDIPRMVNRRSGDGKKKADLDDIFDLWERLDTSKVVLPSFHAISLSRIPPLTFSSADVCSLSAMVHEMKQQLGDMQSKFNELSSLIKDNTKGSCSAPWPTLAPRAVFMAQPTHPMAQPAHAPVLVDQLKSLTPMVPSGSSGSWADHAMTEPINRPPDD